MTRIPDKPFARGALLFTSACLLGAASMHAQVAGTGTIQGIVTDTSGAAVPSAAVTLTEESTHVVRAVRTDSAGVYHFPNIEIGSYTVTVSSPGFKTYSQTHNVLEVGSNIGIDAKLNVGEQQETVTVQSESLALQTEDAKFKQTVDEKEITELPLNSPSRQITGLLAIAGGTAPAPAGDFTGSKFTYQTISISVAGGNGNTTLWRLDGGDNNDYMANGNLPFPFPDALSQFSVESSVLGAQDGMHSGGLVNAVTRSGTNHFHGSGFEFIRNNIINATNFFSTSKDSLHQNQFGGTLGGPIRRDKLFAFGGYQHLISHAASANSTAYVPTPAMLRGDFSACDPVGKVQLVDPLTGATLVGNKYATAPTFNAQALALVKYLPTQLIGSDPCGAVNYSIPNNQTDNEFVTRVDWSVSSKHQLYGRYFLDGYNFPAYYSPTNILLINQAGSLQRTQSFTLGENWTISSAVVNTVHATLLRRSNHRGYNNSTINADALGVQIASAVPSGFQLTAGSRFSIGGSGNALAYFNDTALAFNDDVTMARGRHQLVFGGEFVRNQLNYSNAFEGNGLFQFTGTYSVNGPNGGTKSGGEPLLDLLAGAMAGFQQSKQQQIALRGNVPSVYFQDTFHASKQLTLIAGVRWSPNFYPVDYFNRGGIFSMSAFTSSTFSTVYPNAPAGTLFYGDPGVPRQFVHQKPWQFSPNVGFSWDATGKGATVVRGGFELIYDQVNFFNGQRVQANPPFASTISNVQTATSGPLSFSAPWSKGAYTSSPFPQPTVPTAATAVFYPQSSYYFLKQDLHPAYTEQYTFSLQQQLPHGWQAQLDYIGNHTLHDPIASPLNPAVYVPGVWGPAGTGCGSVVRSGITGAVAGAAGTPCSTTANQAQRYALTMINPVQGNQYGGGAVSAIIADYGWANYNGVIATLQHRLSDSFSVLTNYTYSKCLNTQDANGDVTTVGFPSRDYGPCGSDFRHIFNFVVVARSNVKSLPRLANLALSGWEISPLVHLTSGAPVNVTSGVDISLTNTGQDRPSLIPGVNPYLRTQIQSTGTGRAFLNPAAFCSTACIAPGSYGNVSRNAFRGLPYYQTDAQISRLFPIHEAINLQFRLEGFNILNHPYFAGPSTTATSSSTFGYVTSTGGEGPRVFQGSFKVNF